MAKLGFAYVTVTPFLAAAISTASTNTVIVLNAAGITRVHRNAESVMGIRVEGGWFNVGVWRSARFDLEKTIGIGAVGLVMTGICGYESCKKGGSQAEELHG